MTPSIPIIFEDEDILVVNKPAGITVNRSETTKGDTLQDWADKYLNITPPLQPPKAELSEDGIPDYTTLDPKEVFSSRGGIVHRLDKETSGIMLLAKNPQSFVALQKQFKERVVEKTYVALAHGKVVPSEGEVKAPVGRLPWNRKQFGIVAGGRDSVTKYKTISNYVYSTHNTSHDLSLLELHPETGRTHQIRVHMKFVGHPLFADFLYAGRKTARDDRASLERVFLHARSLSFLHPRTLKRIDLSAALPIELDEFLGKLEKVE